MVARKQSAFGGYNTSTEGVKAHVVGSCGCKAGWFEMFPSLCKVDRGCAAAWQVGLRGGYPGRRLVFSRASSVYRRRAGKIDDAISKRGKRENI